MDFVTAAAEPSPSHTSATLVGTVAVVDMVAYSSIAKILEENIDAASVAKLNRQIQTFVTESLRQLPDRQAYRVVAKTGDGAIVLFQHAEDAHRFGVCVHVSAQVHTGRRSESTAERWFRVGFATGEVNVTSASNLPAEYAGIAIANAVRLEASARAGEIVVDADTFAKLKSETQKLYGPEEVVRGKRSEIYRARRCRVTQAVQTSSATVPLQRRPKILAAGGVGLAAALFCPLLIPAVGERVRGVLFSSNEKHIAVLPIDFAGENRETQALGDGLMDSLAGKLANLDPANKSLFVVPASEVRSHKVVDPSSAMREFGATIVVKGRFEHTSLGAQLDVTVIDSGKNREIGYFEENSQTGDLAALQDRVIMRLGRLMNISGRETTQRSDEKSVAPSAYEDYLSGLGYFERSDMPEHIDLAIKSLGKAVETDPNFALCFAQLAKAYTMKFRLTSNSDVLDQAEIYGKRAMNLDRQMPSAYVALGQIHDLRGKHDLAIEEFREAIRLDPRDSDATAGIAGSYQSAGRNTEAEVAFRKAASLRPDYWYGYNALGNFYEDIGRPQDALVQYNHALELAPGNSWVYTNLGITYLDFDETAMLENAEEAFRRSIAIHPSWLALSYLGAIYAEKHQFMESVETNRAALRMNEKSYTTWYNLALAYEWLKQNQEADVSRAQAIEFAERAVKEDPQDSDAQATLASLYARRGERTKAIEKINISLALDANSKYVCSQIADAYELLGDRNQAMYFVQKAIKLGFNPKRIAKLPEFQGVLTSLTR